MDKALKSSEDQALTELQLHQGKPLLKLECNHPQTSLDHKYLQAGGLNVQLFDKYEN